MKFHDAKVVSIDLGPAENRTAVIGLVDAAGKSYELLLDNLERMRCFDFREGNIVLELTTTTGSTPPLNVMEKLFDLAPETAQPTYLTDRIKKIETGHLTLLHIAPSYGCEIIALCDKVRVLNR
ncbi:MAG TPA: hypothetical protein VMH36_25360 [Alphaproteobacteria bacterium]|nr:hypothetical protein [Alphaproteobacteria bacterium]